MPDNVYNLKLNLSNGSTIDAGNFTAPQGVQGEAGGDVFCKISPISSSGSDLDALANVASNSNVFCAMIVSPDKNTRFRLVTGSLTAQSNLLYLYIMRSVSNDRWSYYWGLTHDGSNYDFVTGDLGGNTSAKIASITSIISLYGAYFKY